MSGKIAACLSLVSLVACPSLAEVDVARLAGWDIVVPEKPPAGVAYAAEELASFLKQATGHQLRIVSRVNRPDRHIFVGESAAMRSNGAGIETQDLGDEDLRIVVKDGNVAIVGGSPRGILYAAYSFLEDFLGVRFLTPDHTHVPQVGDSLIIKDQTKTFRPVFRWRYCYYGANHEHPAFAVRLRNNAVTNDPRLGGRTDWHLINHSFSHFLPVKTYGKEHPEYFSFVNGQRRGFVSDDHFGEGGTQLCVTNPDVKRLILEGALRYLKEHPNRGNVSVSQNDNQMYCRCEQCQAMNDREGSAMGSLLTLVNETADGIAQQHPDEFVGTLAYQYSRKAPAHLRPRPNVAVQLCSIEACLIHSIDDPDCPKNTAFCRDLAEWGEICEHIYIWNYNVNFQNYLAPCPNLRVIGPNLRYFAANSCQGVFMQAAGNAQSTELADLRNYLISNLMWDPDREEANLIDEFLTLHYGAAVGPIREYIRRIHDNAQHRGIHHHCFGTAADYGIDEDMARQAIVLFEQALALADSDELRRRVEKASITAYAAAIDPFAKWIRQNYGRIRAGRDVTPPRELVEQHRENLQRLFALCDKYGADRYSEWLPAETVKKLVPVKSLDSNNSRDEN